MNTIINLAKKSLKKKVTFWVAGSIGISGFLFVFLFLALFLLVVGIISGAASNNSSSSAGSAGYYCSATGEIDSSKWDEVFSNAGKLSGTQDKIISLALEKEIDPVLFAAIALHETSFGTSSAVINKNNPGGLMGVNGLMSFSTLDDGLEAMAKTLYNRIIRDGLVTIEALGAVYAPIGANNDPNGLNQHWVSNVSKIASDLGGFTMNCESINFVEIIGDKAWMVPYTKRITSKYGYRSCSGCSSFHAGIDIAENGIHGTPIVAFADGVVIESKAQGTTFVSSSGNMGKGYGWYVLIDHGNGLQTKYGHMMEKGVPVGTNVKAGDIIGKIGSTGASTAPHLHFEILINGKQIDPFPYVKDFLTE